MAGPGDMPVGDQVAEDRRQPLDRHEHVAGLAAAVAAGVADDQRSDAEELALARDQRGAAPGRMRRRREDRLVEQVFPAAGELALGRDIGRRHQPGPPWLAISTGSFGFTSAERPNESGLIFKRLDGLEDAEAGLVVVSDDGRRHGAARIGATSAACASTIR